MFNYIVSFLFSTESSTEPTPPPPTIPPPDDSAPRRQPSVVSVKMRAGQLCNPETCQHQLELTMSDGTTQLTEPLSGNVIYDQYHTILNFEDKWHVGWVCGDEQLRDQLKPFDRFGEQVVVKKHFV